MVTIEPGTEAGAAGPIGRQTTWGIAAEATMAGTGLVMFLGLVVALDRDDYGVIGAVQGIVGPIMSLALAGAPVLLARRVAEGMAPAPAFSRTLGFVSSVPLGVTAGLVLLQPLLLGPVARLDFVLLGLGYGWLVLAQNQLYQYGVAIGDLRLGTMIRVVSVAPRIAGLVLMLSLAAPGLRLWGGIIVGANLLGLVAGLLLLARAGASPRPTFGGVGADIRSGAIYGLNGASEGVLDASDRPILVNSGAAVAAGDYTIAARIAALALIPVYALMAAVTPKLYASAAVSDADARRVGRTFAWPIAAIGLAAAALLWGTAPLLDRVTSDVDDAVSILRWLSLIPLIKGLQFHAGNVLDALGRPTVRFVGTLIAASVNLVLNLWLIPRHGWQAAVTTTLVCEVALGLGLWSALLWRSS